MEEDHIDLTINTEVLFLQLNDVYHIDFSYDYADDDSLILPRIATVRKRLLDLYPDNLFFCVPGDFLAPSCLSRRFKGAQMIDIFNKIGVNLVTFGNHELEDLSEDILIARINESNFKWIATNIEFKNESKFHQLYESGHLSYYYSIKCASTLLIIILGLLDNFPSKQSKRPEDVFYTIDNPIHHTKKFIDNFNLELSEINNTNLTPFSIALTHQYLDKDILLASQCDDVKLIMGGHDHNIVMETKESHCLIVKTASNARTFRMNWILTINADEIDSLKRDFDEKEVHQVVGKHIYKDTVLPALYKIIFNTTATPGHLEERMKWADLLSTLLDEGVPDRHFNIFAHKLKNEYIIIFSLAINTMNPLFIDMVPENKEVKLAINKWLNESKELLTPIMESPSLLEIEDQKIRKESTNFGNFIADILRGLPLVSSIGNSEFSDVGFINSGTFRIDRNIQKGESITLKTICDIFYFNDKILLYNLSGEEISDILTLANKLRIKGGEGDGNFLQVSGLEIEVRSDTITRVNQVGMFGSKQPLELNKVYTVSTTSFIAETKKSDYKLFFADKIPRELSDNLRGTVIKILENLKRQEIAFDIILSERKRWIFS